MSLIFVAALMMAEAPSAVQPAPVQQAARKAKPAQVCEYIEVTGSRSKRRVCRDADGNLDLGPGVSNSGFGKAKIDGLGTGSTAPVQH